MYACNGLLSFSGEKVESVGAWCSKDAMPSRRFVLSRGHGFSEAAASSTANR